MRDMSYIKLEAGKTYGFELPNGDIITVDPIGDLSYPGLVVDYVGKGYSYEGVPSIRLDIAYNEETDNYDDPKLFVWANPLDDDFTHEIRFERPNLPTNVTYDDIVISDDNDGEDTDEILSDRLSNDYGYCVNNFSYQLKKIGKNKYKAIISEINWDIIE